MVECGASAASVTMPSAGAGTFSSSDSSTSETTDSASSRRFSSSSWTSCTTNSAKGDWESYSADSSTSSTSSDDGRPTQKPSAMPAAPKHRTASVDITAAARTEAAKLGIDVAAVAPSLGGMVGIEDVRRHHAGGGRLRLSAPLQPVKPSRPKPASSAAAKNRLLKEGRKSPPAEGGGRPVGGKRYKPAGPGTSTL